MLKKSLIHSSVSLVSAVFILSTFMSPSFAKDTPTKEQEIAQKLKELFPRVGDVEVSKSTQKNVYQFWMGADLTFVTYNDGFLMLGDIYDTQRKVSLAEGAKKDRLKDLMANFDESKMIIYGPKKPKRVVTIFTDIDCGYCRKLHSEVPELNAAGVQVRYLAYPRSFGNQGPQSESYKKYVSVWCAANRDKALTDAKNGKSIAVKECDNPVAETFMFGRSLDVRGTPSVIYDDGTQQGGYVPAKEMIKRLGL